MMITMVTSQRRAFFRDAALAHQAIETFYAVQSLHPFFLYAFVIMPDHIHILLGIPLSGKVSRVAAAIKRNISFDVGTRPRVGKPAAERKNERWQRSFHLRIVEDAVRAKEYIHANPVRASLCNAPEHYPWSSASGRWDIADLPW